MRGERGVCLILSWLRFNIFFYTPLLTIIFYFCSMPLKKSGLQSAISANIRELMADNKKKEKGAGGKARSRKQILAIAIAAAKRK